MPNVNTSEEQPSRSGGKLLIILLLTVLGGLGAGGWWWGKGQVAAGLVDWLQTKATIESQVDLLLVNKWKPATQTSRDLWAKVRPHLRPMHDYLLAGPGADTGNQEETLRLWAEAKRFDGMSVNTALQIIQDMAAEDPSAKSTSMLLEVWLRLAVCQGGARDGNWVLVEKYSYNWRGFRRNQRLQAYHIQSVQENIPGPVRQLVEQAHAAEEAGDLRAAEAYWREAAPGLNTHYGQLGEAALIRINRARTDAAIAQVRSVAKSALDAGDAGSAVTAWEGFNPQENSDYIKERDEQLTALRETHFQQMYTATKQAHEQGLWHDSLYYLRKALVYDPDNRYLASLLPDIIQELRLYTGDFIPDNTPVLSSQGIDAYFFKKFAREFARGYYALGSNHLPPVGKDVALKLPSSPRDITTITEGLINHELANLFDEENRWCGFAIRPLTGTKLHLPYYVLGGGLADLAMTPKSKWEYHSGLGWPSYSASDKAFFWSGDALQFWITNDGIDVIIFDVDHPSFMRWHADNTAVAAVPAMLAKGKRIEMEEFLRVHGDKPVASKVRAALAEMPRWASSAGEDRYSRWADLTVGGVTQRMRWIKPGTFTMGSPKSEKNRGRDERQHQVTLSRGYWLADTECTQAMWEVVMGQNPSHFIGNPNRPVEQVSWEDCQQFIRKLNTLTTGLQARLPTEAEWEYACRGALTTAYGGNIGWHMRNSDIKTHPVGSKPPNAWGLHDMHGNVGEWCQDWHSRWYPKGSVTNPSGPASGSHRVHRGGNYSYPASESRSAAREREEPDSKTNIIGFRIAAEFSIQKAKDTVEMEQNYQR